MAAAIFAAAPRGRHLAVDRRRNPCGNCGQRRRLLDRQAVRIAAAALRQRVGLTAQRIRIGQWLFERYGGRFVFAAASCRSAQHGGRARRGQPHAGASPCRERDGGGRLGAGLWARPTTWARLADLAAPAAVVLGAAAAVILFGVPALIVRYEKRLLAKIDGEGRATPSGESPPGV